jgi:predicted anti-sigma-YlaC factor YlaD
MIKLWSNGADKNLKMTCPSKELLAAYEEGGLTPEEREMIEMHLADCHECREFIKWIIETTPPDLDEP